MKAIPRALLPHRVTLKKPTGQDTWQETTYEPDIALASVRMEPSSKVILSSTNTEIQLTATLLYYCHNSRPCGIVFEPKQKVSFDGREYTVMTAELLFDEHGSHHWEVGLQ